MRMKIFFISGILSLSCLSLAQADTVYFKDGRVWNGLIGKETASYVELDLGFDVARLERSKIRKVLKSPASERQQLRQFLSQEKLKKDRLLQSRRSKPYAIPYSSENGHVFVDVLIDGKTRAHLLLDTGASVVTLSGSMAKRLGLSSKDLRLIVPLGVADGRQSRGALTVLKSVRLGDCEAKDVAAVILLDESKKSRLGDGMLGMSFLKNFTFKIDSKNRKLILEKNV